MYAHLRTKKWIAACLALLVLSCGMALAEEPTSAPTEAQIESGELRIYLKSLGDPAALGVTLMGTYALEGDAGFRFESGTQLTFAADGIALKMSVGGLTIDMGESLTLTRHASSGESGAYIHGSSRDNLYVGDLRLTNENGKIKVILLADIEQYLYGVVPYEMSDSFPIEALKAQAVAARTYAVGRKSTSIGRAYDVVDTTADQVFFGFDARMQNAIRAVNETKGLVGMYKNNYAMCYYSASNGGQTAMPHHIWGYEGDFGYLDIRDDPYDLENTASLVKSMEISADGSKLTGELKTLLRSGLREPLASLGYSDEENDFSILSIVDIEPVEPIFDDGSRMMRKLRFVMEVMARHYDEVEVPADPNATLPPEGEGSPETRTETVLGEPAPAKELMSVDLLVYEHFKDKFGLSISVADCELVSVVKKYADGDLSAERPIGFGVEMRRFGHGVGMSQRGAQIMGGSAYGFSYQDILSFYYPNMELKQMNFLEKPLTDLGQLPVTFGKERPRPTPKPTPMPLPALETGERYAKVSLASNGSTLNVREQPVDGRIVGVLENGQRLIVVKELGDGWASVKTGELSGYASMEFIQIE